MVTVDDVQKAKETVMASEGYLHIKRLPKNTVREIIQFLNNTDEFGGDWGVGMKFIWDTFKGTLPPKDAAVQDALMLLNQRVLMLEEKIVQRKSTNDKNTKVKKMADGSVREVK